MKSTLQVTTVKPYDWSQYMGSNSYSIQNMLLRQVEFPFEYHRHDYINSVYSDRLPHDEYHKKLAKLKIVGGGIENWVSSVATPKQLLKFVRDIFDNKKITGCRVVRFSNNGGFSLLRFDAYIKTNKQIKTYNNQEGPSIEWPEPEMRQDGTMIMYFG